MRVSRADRVPLTEERLSPAPATTRRGGGGSLAVGFITLLVVGTDLFIVSPLLPAISRHFHVSPGTAGNAVTVFSIVYVLGAPAFGSLADRIGRRTVLAAGLVAFAAANVLTGLAPSFAVLLLARVLAGLAAAAVSPSVYALVGAAAPAHRRGVWMSTAVAGFLISLTTGAPSGTALAAVWGWRAVFVVLALPAAALAAVNLAVWPHASKPGATGTAPPPAPIGLLTRARAVTVTGLWAFAVYALYTYLGTGLRADAKLSTGLVALALIVFGAGAVAGSFGGGRLADRFGARRVATASLALVGVMLLLLDLAVRAPVPLLMCALFFFALCAYPCLPSYQAQLVSSFPQHSGSLLAWNSSCMYLGTALGSAAGSALLSTAGFRAIPLASAAVAFLGAFFCAFWAISRKPE
ncbi:MFS transporter [Streptomyces camelliae]|uniref:MFS transporter n=1 Tax=Streptomyces camelliae TaxID=3004093 RepID=A0ABY7P101_9ACTN|nr:MFS transporter [Streptomyces sp. HUAS 2-6]WBO63432.1 MFS transporter [Streptomyces sp. HUAS 2-6]